MFVAETIFINQIPGEEQLRSWLQQNLCLSINNKTLKRGRLLLYKRFHYFIQLCMLTERGHKENIDIPIPFEIDLHEDEGLMYFDYRVKSLNLENTPRIGEKTTSMFLNKILEIQVINNTQLSCF